MKKSKFKSSQVLRVLTESDQGNQAKELCRKHGISYGTRITRRRNMSASRP
jgi:hypothetical protein